MLLYAATIFVSAFLLFLVQPVVAKQILPWFGGSAAVWTTCLVFFQTALLAGYAYSDFVVRRLGARTQLKLHTLLLVASVAVLPIIPGAHWKPTGTESSVVAHPRPPRRDDRLAVFPAVDDEPARAGLVRAGAARRESRIGCSRCRTSRRCWRSSAIRSCSSRGRRRARRPGDGRSATCSSSACAPRPAGSSARRVAAPTTSASSARSGRGQDRGDRRAAAHRRPPGALVHARRHRVAAAPRRVEPHHAEHRGRAAPLDRAARDLPPHVHPLLRRQGLVPARHLSRDAGGGTRRHGLDARRFEAHARARDPDRRVLRRPLPRVHVLPRGARAAEARARAPDALLPDDLAGRRAGLGAGRASSRRSCCRRISSSPSGSSSPRCCSCGRCGRDTSSSARSPPPRS